MPTLGQGWRVAKWGPLGWLETALKGIGIMTGIIAFFSAGSGPLLLADNPNPPLLAYAGVLVAVVISILGARVIQQEIVSIVFALFNIVGHAGMFIAIARGADLGALPVLFGAAYVAGEIVKQRFLAVTGYVEFINNPMLIRLAAGTALLAYAGFTLVALLT